MTFGINRTTAPLQRELGNAADIVVDFCLHENPSGFTTIMQCQQAVAICFRRICDIFSADSRLWNALRIRSYLLQAMDTLRTHVSKNANWKDIGLHMKEKYDSTFLSDVSDKELMIRADKAKYIFEIACTQYVQTFPTDETTSWEEIISKQGMLPPQEEAALLRSPFALWHYKRALGRLGIKLAHNVTRTSWERFVVHGPDDIWRPDYRLPDIGEQITMEEGRKILERARHVLTAYWPGISREGGWAQLTPDLCCMNPELVNKAFFELFMLEKR